MDIVAAAVTANCSQRSSGRGYAQVSNGRSLRRLLCARRDRCRAPEKRDELAPFQLIELHPLPLARAAA
jgi:hypothetical protein